MIVTQDDINLVKQAVQKRLIMIQVLNRDFLRISTIQGQIISITNNVDSTSDIRRTASLTMNVFENSLQNLLDLNLTNYIKLYRGIQNNNTKETSWYCQGVFIINSNGFSYNLTDKTLSLGLSDLMYDFTGDRKGTLFAYQPLIKHDEKIQDVMIDMVEGGGITNYDIAPICPYSESLFNKTSIEIETDYLIPYDINFSTGVTRYEVLCKMRDLYPKWEIFFDENGKFICQKQLLEQDDSAVKIDDVMLRGLVIDENRNIDLKEVRNVIDVWGKDGLYYGTWKDETPSSPFNVNAIGEIRKVFSGGEYDTIFTTYYDDEQTKIQSDGNDMAKDWAEYLGYQYSRLQDKLTLTLISCPFINDVNFKISYRSKFDNKIQNYVVKSVSHSNDTTTLECIKFYSENCYALLTALDKPTISNYSVNGLNVSITVSPVIFATGYDLYSNNLKVSSSTSTTISYTFRTDNVGTFNLSVKATANGYKDSNVSNSIEVVIANDTIQTIDGEDITTIDGDDILYI